MKYVALRVLTWIQSMSFFFVSVCLENDTQKKEKIQFASLQFRVSSGRWMRLLNTRQRSRTPRHKTRFVIPAQFSFSAVIISDALTQSYKALWDAKTAATFLQSEELSFLSGSQKIHFFFLASQRKLYLFGKRFFWHSQTRDDQFFFMNV